MRRFRYLPYIVVAILTLFAIVGCDPEEPELVATAVPTDNPTSMPDPKATAEPVPTERAANAQPTASPQFQVFNIGDTVRLGDLHITVNSVRVSLGDDFFTPEEGNYFIYVDVTFRNEGNKPEVVSSLLSMEIRDAEGRSYDVDLSAVTAADSPSPDGEIAQGDTIRGEVGFQLPVSATDLTWRFSGNLFQLGQAIFSLGNVAVPVPLSGSTLDESPTTTPTPTVSQTPLPTPTRASTPTPTREPTRTPEPTPVVIGTTVAAGGSSYTLNEVKDPAPAGIFGVAEGKRLIALDITQVGISDDGDPFNALYFAVQDSDGYVYSAGLADADVEPQFGWGELAAGQIVRGWVVLELPESARLVSVMVEAEVFGSRITISEFTQDQAGDLASQTIPPVPLPPLSPVAIGTTVAAGGSSYTLNEVKDPAPAGIFGVAEGKRLIALDITQVGISDDGDPFNALYFAVQDSDGYVYSAGLADADVEPQFGWGELAAGQIVRGWVVLELPESTRLVSVMVEAEIFGPRTTIADLGNPIPRNGATTPTPIAEAEVISTMQMKVTDSSGNHISTMEQWRPLVRPEHWKKGRSAYSLADFILNQHGAAYMESSISSVLSQPIILEQGTPEYAAKFDRYSGPARLDIGISGQAGAKQTLFVGVEAKVDEPFGSETVCERYNQAIEYLSSNPRSKAAARVEELLALYLGDTDEPCESRFADIGYQLLTAAAGTVAQQKDVSVFYVAVFKSGEFDEVKGEENRLDYENFINLAGGERLMRDHDVSLSHEMTLNGRRLVCIYEYFNAEA